MPKNTETAGGSRFSEGKTSGWWYAPIRGIEAVVRVAKQGGEKYAPCDWKEGQSYSTLWDCMMRHLMAAQYKGIHSINESDGNETHLAHAAWNLLCLLTFMEEGREDLDDISPWYGITADLREEAEQIAEENDMSVIQVLRMIKENDNGT